jgi:hypothetical protein
MCSVTIVNNLPTTNRTGLIQAAGDRDKKGSTSQTLTYQRLLKLNKRIFD